MFGTPAVVSFTLDDGGEKAEASGQDVARALYEDPPAPAITAAKFVSTVANQCGNSNALTVPAGTTVYYCYTVTNTGNVTLTSHTVVDDKLGPIVTDLALDLAPGASATVFSSGVQVSDTVTNTATWAASADVPDTTLQSSVTVTAQATSTATVTVTIAPEVVQPEFTG